MDGGGIDPGFEELDDLLLYIGALLAAARHGCGVAVEAGCSLSTVPGVSGVRRWCILAGESGG